MLAHRYGGKRQSYGDLQAEGVLAEAPTVAAAEALDAAESSFLDQLFSGLDDQLSSNALVPGPLDMKTPEANKAEANKAEDTGKPTTSLTVEELKKICRELGLKVGGTKGVLVERVQEARSSSAEGQS